MQTLIHVNVIQILLKFWYLSTLLQKLYQFEILTFDMEKFGGVGFLVWSVRKFGVVAGAPLPQFA